MFEKVRLYYSVIDARSRFIRSLLTAKGIEFEPYKIEYWHPKEQRIKVYKGIDFRLSALEVCSAKQITRFDSAQRIPILVCNEGTFVGVIPIVETINENYEADPIFGPTIKERAEHRRLLDWFFHKFEPEVYTPILNSRYYQKNDFKTLEAGRKNLSKHLEYMENILLKNTFGIHDWQQAKADKQHDLRKEDSGYPQSLQLVSMNSRQNKLPHTSDGWHPDTSNRPLGIADYCAGAYISSLDYLGEFGKGGELWAEYPIIKLWYQRIKAQPPFAPILNDYIPILKDLPPKYYKDVNF